MEKLKVGLSGAPRGSSFVGAFKSIPDTEVTGIFDPDAGRLQEIADRHGIPGRYTNFEAMLEGEGLDIVVVASPMQHHVPQSVVALERGIHVLSEVTAAVDLEQCEDLVRAVRASDVKYMMGRTTATCVPTTSS